MKRRAFLAVGSNVGDRPANMLVAIDAFREDAFAVSPIYETDPVDSPLEQDNFFNAVIELYTDRSPRELLTLAKRAEQLAQRKETVRNGPRTLDIDVLLVGDERVDEPGLTVPHPRMWNRRFVLAPLADLAPELVPPVLLEKAIGAVRQVQKWNLPMHVYETVDAFWQVMHAARRSGRTVGFVPTMGALHEGHLSLVRRAVERNDLVAMSIFVNPLQFGPSEDLSKYPRQLQADTEKAASVGVTHLFVPGVEEMYPNGGLQTTVRVEGVTEMLEGKLRPGHFDGVATVVAKLFAIVGECRTYFGEKDWQQLEVVRRLVADLAMPVTVIGCPIVREPGGLALSSRNIYLDASERASALQLGVALNAGIVAFRAGENSSEAISELMIQVLSEDPSVDPQYAAHVGPGMTHKAVVEKGDRLLVAAKVGPTRLIDNIEVD